MELAKHDPLSVGVLLAGMLATKAITCVGLAAGAGVWVVGCELVFELIFEKAKNCPTPKRMTTTKTMMTTTLLVLFIS
jgi:hypothetical protein